MTASVLQGSRCCHLCLGETQRQAQEGQPRSCGERVSGCPAWGCLQGEPEEAKGGPM